jgi:hypothetical protein
MRGIDRRLLGKAMMARVCVVVRAIGLQPRCPMLRSPGVWYLATLFAALGLLSAIALDALRGRPQGHVLAPAPSPAPAGARNSESPKSQSGVESSTLPAARIAAFGTQAVQRATPAQPVSVVVPPSVIAVPAPEVQAIAPWPSATVTTSFTRADSVALSGDQGARSRSCLASWDRETHMSKDEWKEACQRTPRRQ